MPLPQHAPASQITQRSLRLSCSFLSLHSCPSCQIAEPVTSGSVKHLLSGAPLPFPLLHQLPPWSCLPGIDLLASLSPTRWEQLWRVVRLVLGPRACSPGALRRRRELQSLEGDRQPPWSKVKPSSLSLSLTMTPTVSLCHMLPAIVTQHPHPESTSQQANQSQTDTICQV